MPKLNPEAAVFWRPHEPSAFEAVSFTASAWDPDRLGIASWAWDFGDGANGDGRAPAHRYDADGDYAVTLRVATPDGRVAEATACVRVRTRDVAIVELSVPRSARTGETHAMGVGVASPRCRERVSVRLFRATRASAFELVGSGTGDVRPSRTTRFTFAYTFTATDADAGSVTFKAVASIVGGLDAVPSDNDAVALPTPVSAG